jgi:predicted RNA binding protein YcfA (HicA-like mRNA interferase family)
MVGASGSHQKWRHPGTGKQVIVAHHSGRVLPLGTMKAIIEGSGIAPSKWMS